MTKPLPPSYLCPRCLLRSYHPRDVAERYCARCGFEDDQPDRGNGRAGPTPGSKG
jgi:ribosomal protein L37E